MHSFVFSFFLLIANNTKEIVLPGPDFFLFFNNFSSRVYFHFLNPDHTACTTSVLDSPITTFCPPCAVVKSEENKSSPNSFPYWDELQNWGREINSSGRHFVLDSFNQLFSETSVSKYGWEEIFAGNYAHIHPPRNSKCLSILWKYKLKQAEKIFVSDSCCSPLRICPGLITNFSLNPWRFALFCNWPLCLFFSWEVCFGWWLLFVPY